MKSNIYFIICCFVQVKHLFSLFSIKFLILSPNKIADLIIRKDRQANISFCLAKKGSQNEFSLQFLYF